MRKVQITQVLLKDDDYLWRYTYRFTDIRPNKTTFLILTMLHR